MKYLILAVVLLVPCIASAGNIYKCKGPNGTVYQNAPCATDSQTLDHQQYRDPPPQTTTYTFDQASPYTQQPNTVNYGATPPDVYRASPTQERLPPSEVPLPHIMDTGGIGSSPYQRGEIRALKCTTASGSVYYDTRCGHSSVAVSGRYNAYDINTGRLVSDNVSARGLPALDRMTGHLFQPQHLRYESYQTLVPDVGEPIDVDVACRRVQQIAGPIPSGANKRRVQALCRQGRSMYDVKPGARSLYAPTLP